jgi:ABC-type amino acid transport substrate-binding protein
MMRSSGRSLRASALALLGAACVLVILVAAGCGDDDEPASGGSNAASGGKTLKVGMTLDLPPQGFLDENGDPTGFEYNMLVAAADKLGYKPDIVRTPFEQAFVALSADKYAMFVGGIYIRCERLNGEEAKLAFSVPVYDEDQAITTSKDKASEITSLADMDGKTLAIEAKGSTADAVSSEFMKANPDVKIKRDYYDNVTDAVLALSQGRADAMLQARIVTLDAIKSDPDLVISGGVPDSAYPVGFVFKPGDPLKDEFNKAINEMKESGELAKIWQDWFKEPPPAGSPTTEVVPEVTLDTCKTAG